MILCFNTVNELFKAFVESNFPILRILLFESLMGTYGRLQIFMKNSNDIALSSAAMVLIPWVPTSIPMMIINLSPKKFVLANLFI
jgi:hypothetical protein